MSFSSTAASRYLTAYAEKVFQQISDLGEYGFPELHAASFALISYAAAYLKCHYSAEFTCALLNAQPIGFYSIATIVEDAIRHGVAILPIDVCSSQWQCTLERAEDHTWAMRMGLRFVKGLGEKAGDTIITTREAGGYHSLADFVRRTRLDAEVVSVLAEAGALWAGVLTLVLITRVVWEQATGAQSTEVRYFLSSLPPPARSIGSAIRGHGSIENGLHWVFDVVFREDARRVYDRTTAENVAFLNRLVLSLLRGDSGKGSLKVKRKRAGWHISYLAQLLGFYST